MTGDAVRAHDFAISLLDPAGASAVLDLGCGRGEDLRRIGALAPAGARLVGVDASPESIAHARQAAAGDPRCTFLVHDLSADLPFGDAEFDRVLSVNLLECIPDKQRLLRQVHRVLRPGGRVVFAHWDWDSQLVDGQDKALVRHVLHTFADWKQAWMADADGWMGRRLWRTFQASGLFEGSVHPYVLTSTRFAPGTLRVRVGGRRSRPGAAGDDHPGAVRPVRRRAHRPRCRRPVLLQHHDVRLRGPRPLTAQTAPRLPARSHTCM
jgi:SAM-dependent methyltransferase